MLRIFQDTPEEISNPKEKLSRKFSFTKQDKESLNFTSSGVQPPQTIQNATQNNTNHKTKIQPQRFSYLIYIERGQTLSAVFLGEFQNQEQYLTPLYDVILKDQSIDLSFRINPSDLDGIHLADEPAAYLGDLPLDTSISLIDLQMVKFGSKKFLLFASKNALFVQPLCFPNQKMLQSGSTNQSGGTNTFSTFLGCADCPFSTYSSILSSSSCEPSHPMLDMSPFSLLHWKDLSCPIKSQKGPLCQTCSEFMLTFLPKEKNVQLLDFPEPTTVNGINRCSFECPNKQFKNNRHLEQASYNTTDLESDTQTIELGNTDVSQNLQLLNDLQLKIKEAPAKEVADSKDSEQDLRNKKKITQTNKDEQKNTEIGVIINDNNSKKINFNETETEVFQVNECVAGQDVEKYLDFCGQISACLQCAYHPFCTFDSEKAKCVKTVDKHGRLVETPYEHYFRKFLACEVQNPQKVCKINATSSRQRGDLVFSKSEEIVKWELEDKGVQLEVDNSQPYEFVQQYQLCSWLIDSTVNPSINFFLKIQTLPGLFRGKSSIPTDLIFCYAMNSTKQVRSNEECKLVKISLRLGDNTLKRVKFQGGSFRISLIFKEHALIDTSKISIYYMPIERHEKRTALVIISTFVVVAGSAIVVLAFSFRNQILYFIRVRCNTLAFLRWEEDTELNEVSAKKIIRRLEKEKLLKTRKKGFQRDDNPYKHTDCSICLSDFATADNLYVLICSHRFHAHCLEEWIKVQFNPVTCPICKIALTKNAFAQIEMLQLNMQSQQSMQRQQTVEHPSPNSQIVSAPSITSAINLNDSLDYQMEEQDNLLS